MEIKLRSDGPGVEGGFLSWVQENSLNFQLTTQSSTSYTEYNNANFTCFNPSKFHQSKDYQSTFYVHALFRIHASIVPDDFKWVWFCEN